jgi:hypothetical protein
LPIQTKNKITPIKTKTLTPIKSKKQSTPIKSKTESKLIKLNFKINDDAQPLLVAPKKEIIETFESVIIPDDPKHNFTPCEILNKAHTRASLIELLQQKSQLSNKQLNSMRKIDLCEIARALSVKSVVDNYKKEYEHIITAPDISTIAERIKQNEFMHKMYQMSDALKLKVKKSIFRSFTPKYSLLQKGNDNLVSEYVLQALKKEVNTWGWMKWFKKKPDPSEQKLDANLALIEALENEFWKN